MVNVLGNNETCQLLRLVWLWGLSTVLKVPASGALQSTIPLTKRYSTGDRHSDAFCFYVRKERDGGYRNLE